MIEEQRIFYDRDANSPLFTVTFGDHKGEVVTSHRLGGPPRRAESYYRLFHCFDRPVWIVDQINECAGIA